MYQTSDVFFKRIETVYMKVIHVLALPSNNRKDLKREMRKEVQGSQGLSRILSIRLNVMQNKP